jgi:hypothetical protein
MKNFLRHWLGINDDIQLIAKDVNTLDERTNAQQRQTFELFHAMPFAKNVLQIDAKDAAAITQPNGIQANSLPALCMGIVLNARQGNSAMEVTGELPEFCRQKLLQRGFKVEDSEGTAGKMTHIIWT